MNTNHKKSHIRFNSCLFLKDFVRTPLWRTIRFRAALLSALCISFGTLLPFFIGLAVAWDQSGTPYFLQHYAFSTGVAVLVCLPLSVFLVRTGQHLYARILKNCLRDYGFCQ